MSQGFSHFSKVFCIIFIGQISYQQHKGLGGAISAVFVFLTATCENCAATYSLD